MVVPPKLPKDIGQHGPHNLFHKQLLNTHVALEQLLNEFHNLFLKPLLNAQMVFEQGVNPLVPK